MANTMGIESFLGISTSAQFILKHGGSTGTGFAIGANGRSGGNSVRGNSSTNVQVAFDSVATAYMGGAVRPPAGAMSANEFLSVADGTVTHLTVMVKTDGSLEIRRGTSGGTILATSTLTGLIVAGTYQHVEFSFTISDTVGTFDIKINGIAVAWSLVTGTITTQDTRNGGTAAVTRLFWWFSQTGQDWTDLYYNQSGYWGDGRIEMLKPTAEGNSSQWTPSTGTDNSALVDDQTPNDDTDYVSSGNVGDKDTNVMADLVSTGGTIQCVQGVDYFRKDDAGVRSIVGVMRLSGTEVDSAVASSSSTYSYLRDPRTTKPGGGAWAIADVNNNEKGYKVNA